MARLSKEFAKSYKINPSLVRQFIETAEDLEGSNEYRNNRKYLYEAVHIGGQVIEWNIKHKPTVLITPKYIGDALRQVVGLDLETSRNDYPGDEFELVRKGEIALMHTSPEYLRIVLLSKEKALEALDKIEKRQTKEGRLADTIERFMEDLGLQPEDIEDLFGGMRVDPSTVDYLMEIGSKARKPDLE